ncbi:MAG: SLC13/DASS family transporter [Schwartzia sp.]|nr:SLC13/DASS family transporter [Schwartzia sp. (in: firmicutes)]
MEATVCLIILAIMCFFFVTELLPPMVTAMGGAVAVGLAGLVPVKALAGDYSNGMVVLFASMYVVGAAMFHTGLAQKIGGMIVRAAGRGERSLMSGSMAAGAVMSSVLSNTGTTAALLPVILGICSASRISPQRQLMPLAFSCGLGGLVTIVGSPPNLIASVALENAGLPGFGFFEYAWIGVPLTVAGILYMTLIGKHFLPRGNATGEGIDEDAAVEAQATENDPRKMHAAAAICAAAFLMLAVGSHLVPMHITALTAALLLVATGCLTEKQAIAGIDWATIILFVGMMPVAVALDVSGAGRLIAGMVVSFMGESPSPLMVTSTLFAFACLLTQFMSNTALTILLCPIGISVARQIGANPHGVLMVIAVAASCAFATPVGTPPNQLVMGPGGYQFRDYVIVGLPLVAVCYLVCLFVIPAGWPLFP